MVTQAIPMTACPTLRIVPLCTEVEKHSISRPKWLEMVLNYEILSHIKQHLVLQPNNVVRSKSLAIERIVFQIVSHRKTRSLLLLLAAENTHQITFFCF